MFVRISTNKKDEIDYILRLIESSSDAKLLRKKAYIENNDSVYYVLELAVNPEL